MLIFYVFGQLSLFDLLIAEVFSSFCRVSCKFPWSVFFVSAVTLVFLSEIPEVCLIRLVLLWEGSCELCCRLLELRDPIRVVCKNLLFGFSFLFLLQHKRMIVKHFNQKAINYCKNKKVALNSMNKNFISCMSYSDCRTSQQYGKITHQPSTPIFSATSAALFDSAIISS